MTNFFSSAWKAIWVLLFGQLRRHIISMGFHVHVCVVVYVIFRFLCHYGSKFMCSCVSVYRLDWLLLFGTQTASRRDGKFNIKISIQSHPVCVCVWCKKPHTELHRCATIWISTFFLLLFLVFFSRFVIVCVSFVLQELKTFFGDKFAFWMIVKNVGDRYWEQNLTKRKTDSIWIFPRHGTIEIRLVVVAAAVIPIVRILLACCLSVCLCALFASISLFSHWYKIRSCCSRLHWIKMSQQDKTQKQPHYNIMKWMLTKQKRKKWK